MQRTMLRLRTMLRKISPNRALNFYSLLFTHTHTRAWTKVPFEGGGHGGSTGCMQQVLQMQYIDQLPDCIPRCPANRFTVFLHVQG
eukprot:653694-Amphidinium_carterae.1